MSVKCEQKPKVKCQCGTIVSFSSEDIKINEWQTQLTRENDYGERVKSGTQSHNEEYIICPCKKRREITIKESHGDTHYNSGGSYSYIFY